MTQSFLVPVVIALSIITGVLAVFVLSSMKPKLRLRIVDVAVVAFIGWVIYNNVVTSAPPAPPSTFYQSVNIDPFRAVALQANGRIKSFDSFARTMMRYVSGPHRIAGQDAAFTYLDLMLRPEAYRDADIIYVKKKQVREAIADQLARVPDVPMDVLDSFRDRGLISPALMGQPVVGDLLDQLEQDLMRTAKPVNAIRSAMSVARPETLSRSLRIIPPPGKGTMDSWYLGQDVWGAGPRDDIHAGMTSGRSIPGLDAEMRTQMTQTWNKLVTAWRQLDAPQVNEHVARLAALVRAVEPSIYPQLDKLKLENWYFRYKSMTWVWLFYLLGVIPLLMSVIYRWKRARRLGMGLFIVAFGFHTAALGIRWYLSGRIPNSNMFEAITAATWFGGVIAFVLEWASRKTAMRNMFFLGSACASMTAMMASHFLPVQLSSDIGNIMPVLHDIWLYIHTNMIIASYALIAMAAVSALLYLRHRFGGGGPEMAVMGGAGSLMMRTSSGGNFLQGSKVTGGQVLDGATMVLMELSFVMLWAGLVMGAIWADHSWGRPWGWDPKEVFALNTFIIFLLLVHVRFKVKDKGLWTAVLAVVGCGVMLFNWIVVNFIITGLHSYA